MSATTVPRSTPGIFVWLRKAGSTLARPLFAVVLALIAGSIVIMLTVPGGLDTRFNAVVNAYQSLLQGSFGDAQSFSFTLVRVGPLIFAGLSVAIAFRAGLFNIGASGQLAMGAMASSLIGYYLPSAPGWLLIPLMLLGSIVAGGIWGGIVGILKAWRGAHEVVTTIMLNWTAFYFTDYLIDGPFKATGQSNQTAAIPVQAQLPLVSSFYNQTIGALLPKIPTPEAYSVDVSIFLALLALVIYWFITSRTTFGYEIRVLGQNLRAAKYAGISIQRNMFLAMALAGAFAGLAGSCRLMGQAPYQLTGSTFSIDPTGFDAIGVAMLGRTTAVGVLLGALLFGGLRQGGSFMALNANISSDLVYIIQALVLFNIAAEFLPAIQRSLPGWLTLNKRPALVAPIVGSSAVDPTISPNETPPDDAEIAVHPGSHNEEEG
ncbi:MAG TPA: ABC transporter permease [Ktedonobacteraceae bacterium]